MQTQKISKSITKVVLLLLFFLVFFMSILFSETWNFESLLVALVKGCIASALGWIFFIILSDTLVKSIVASALESKATREEGGFLYHFIEPSENEIPESKENSKKNNAKT